MAKRIRSSGRFERPEIEHDIEKQCRKCVEKLGGKMVKTVALGHTGFPDRMVILPKFTAFVELKRFGEEPTPKQQYWLLLLKQAGNNTAWFDSFAGFELYLRRHGFAT
jgi:hypothetical protein